MKALLNHRCTVRRRTGTTDGAFGEVVPTWTDTESVPCRYEALGTGRELTTNVAAVVDRVRMYFGNDVAISANDKVLSVVDEAGVSVMTEGDVELVSAVSGRGRVHHFECLLKTVVAG